MKSLIIFSLILTSLLTNAAIKKERPETLASLSMESGKVYSHYKVVSVPDNEARLERTGKKVSSRTVKIPKGLAMTIKSDLLMLAWQAQYKPSRGAAALCKSIVMLEIRFEDTIKICAEQTLEFQKAQALQKRLDKLIK